MEAAIRVWDYITTWAINRSFYFVLGTRQIKRNVWLGANDANARQPTQLIWLNKEMKLSVGSVW